MTDVIVDSLEELIDRYADRIRSDARPGREMSYAGGFIDAMTDPDSRHSLARRQQKARAILAAAQRVRDERRKADRP